MSGGEREWERSSLATGSLPPLSTTQTWGGPVGRPWSPPVVVEEDDLGVGVERREGESMSIPPDSGLC